MTGMEERLTFCSRISKITVEPFLGMSVFVFAYNILIIPQLMQDKVCRNMYNATICDNLGEKKLIHFQNQVQQNAARWMSIVPATSLLPGLVMIFIIGPLTDVLGKKFFMILPPFVYLIQSIIFISLCTLKHHFHAGLFLIPTCLAGIFGENAGTVLLSVSYIADITLPEERTIRLSFLESFIFSGTLISALSTGAIVNKFGFVGGFITTAIISIINLNYVIFVIPSEEKLKLSQADSHKHADYGSLLEKDADSTKMETFSQSERGIANRNCKKIIEILKNDGHPRACVSRIHEAICQNIKRNMICAVIVLLAIALFANMGEVYMAVLYLKHYPFNMSPVEIGYLVTVTSTVSAIGLILIPYICQRFLKMNDLGLLLIGFSAQIILYMAAGFSVSSLMMFLVQIIGLCSSVHLPVLRSMTTKLVNEDQHGTAITIVEAVDIISSLIASFLSNVIYSATVKIFPGFSCCILAMIAFVGLIGAVVFRQRYKSSYIYKSKDDEISCENIDEKLH